MSDLNGVVGYARRWIELHRENKFQREAAKIMQRVVDALESVRTERDDALARIAEAANVIERVREVEAERDAAVAAIERVRAVLVKWEAQQEHNREILGSGGLGHFQAIDCTGDLRAALDGAPEPEEEA